LKFMEEMILHVLERVKGIKIDGPLTRMGYQEAMDRFGSDRPDTRFGLELRDVTPGVQNSEFRVFADTVNKGGVVKGN